MIKVSDKNGEEMRVLTGFDSVAKWHYLAGVSPQELGSQPLEIDYELIKEEVTELLLAIHNKDLVNIAEELADLLVVTNRMAYSMGLDGDTLLLSAMESNWTKFAKDEQEAIDSVSKYDSERGEGYASYKKLKNSDLYLVFRTEDGKILKSVGYTDKDFSSIGEANDRDKPLSP